LNGRVRRTKRADQASALALHLFIFGQARSNFAKNSRRVWICRVYDSIVHPFTFAPRANDACSAQVRQMPRYLGLTLSENFYEETHAHFVIPD
jgi:hypothetical protein